MVKLQLVVTESRAACRLCVLAGPTFGDLVDSLRMLPRSVYVAPHYWRVDMGGMAWLRAAGLQVEEGVLDPVLRDLAHSATLGLAPDPDLERRSAVEDYPRD
jgi:hypothetical protein